MNEIPDRTTRDTPLVTDRPTGTNLAAKARIEGDHLRALRLAGASEAIKEAAGAQAPPQFLDLPDPREEARRTLGEAAVAAARNEGRAMSIEQTVAYARGEA
jgi:hypothetical protein